MLVSCCLPIAYQALPSTYNQKLSPVVPAERAYKKYGMMPDVRMEDFSGRKILVITNWPKLGTRHRHERLDIWKSPYITKAIAYGLHIWTFKI